MRSAFLVLVLSLPAVASAQHAEGDSNGIRRVLTPALPDTLTTAAFDALPDGAAFSGVVADRHPDGRLALLRSVVRGQPTGLWTEWYPSGVVRYLAEWHPEGKGEGVWYYFHESGLVRDRSVLRRDRSRGLTEGWHANGQKAYEGHYFDNARVGRWRWWNTLGRLDSTRTYADPDGTTGWAPSLADPAVRPLAPGVVSTLGAEEFALAPGGRAAFLRAAASPRESTYPLMASRSRYAARPPLK